MMKKYVLIFVLAIGSIAYSQQLSNEQLEEIATAQLIELSEYFDNNQLPISASQRDEILKINIIVQDKINSIKAHPENILEPNELEEAIIYRNNHRISATKRLLSPEQLQLYEQFYPTSELNHQGFQL